MATTNFTMNIAKQADKDEFYTLPEDIDRECSLHVNKFKNKIVYCNCDNPTTSNFFSYFVLNFKKFGLKKLICSHYSSESALMSNIFYEDNKNMINTNNNI